jgi:hypothetical protein
MISTQKPLPFLKALACCAAISAVGMPALAAEDARGDEKSPQASKEVQLGSMEATQAKTAFLGFRFINDGRLPTTAEESKRLRMIEDKLKANLEKSGTYSFVALPDDVRTKIEGGQDIAQCGGCGTEYGKQLGAKQIAWGTVQKVSNLILNINVYMANAEDEKVTFVKSVDIRGNTDETWTQGIDYMSRYILKRPATADAKAAK